MPVPLSSVSIGKIPAAINLVCSLSCSTSRTKVSGGMAAVSAFMGNSIRRSIPIRSKTRLFSSLVVSSACGFPEKNTPGGGSKVKTADCSPSSFAFRI